MALKTLLRPSPYPYGNAHFQTNGNTQIVNSQKRNQLYSAESVSKHPGGENPGDNLQETHGPPPPNHPTLISADLCGSVFHRSNHPGGENTGVVTPMKPMLFI